MPFGGRASPLFICPGNHRGMVSRFLAAISTGSARICWPSTAVTRNAPGVEFRQAAIHPARLSHDNRVPGEVTTCPGRHFIFCLVASFSSARMSSLVVAGVSAPEHALRRQAVIWSRRVAPTWQPDGDTGQGRFRQSRPPVGPGKGIAAGGLVSLALSTSTSRRPGNSAVLPVSG